MENLNRLKIVLFEKNRNSKWLSIQLGVNPSTVSKWVYKFFSARLEQSPKNRRFT
jgi:hypothetical protein